MTRYVIDGPAVIQLARDGVAVPEHHRLVAPNVLRSDALALLYGAVRRGEISSELGRKLLDRVATTKIRLLGDRGSRDTAWRLAEQFGWDDTTGAEYIAVARLQADALIALDPELERRARGVVPIASITELYP